MPLSTHILLGLLLDSSKIFSKALSILIPLLSVKETIRAYLLKISITHNKKRIPLLNLRINCMFARSASQILSKKGEYTFLFLSFLLISLCNLSANYLSEIFSFLTVPPEFL